MLLTAELTLHTTCNHFLLREGLVLELQALPRVLWVSIFLVGSFIVLVLGWHSNIEIFFLICSFYLNEPCIFSSILLTSAWVIMKIWYIFVMGWKKKKQLALGTHLRQLLKQLLWVPSDKRWYYNYWLINGLLVLIERNDEFNVSGFCWTLGVIVSLLALISALQALNVNALFVLIVVQWEE